MSTNASPKKWLLLRGLTREQRHWGPFRRQFSDMVGANKVFCLDHLGVGTEAGRPLVYSVEGMTSDLRRRWLELKGPGASPWGIVSLSMGSMVSLDWCSRFPQDFVTQVIMNVSSSTDSRPWHRLLLDNLPNFSQIVRSPDDVQRERKVLDMCTNLLSAETKDQLAAEWGAMALPKAQIRKVALAQLWASSRFKRPSQMMVPTLALVSAADRLVHPTCTMSVAAALNCTLEIHPTAGHEITLDDPTWVIERIQKFIK